MTFWNWRPSDKEADLSFLLVTDPWLIFKTILCFLQRELELWEFEVNSRRRWQKPG